MTDEDVALEQPEAQTDDAELSEEDKAMAKLKEAVTVVREDLGALRLKLTVTVPRDTVDERMGDQFRELKRDADVPGFRKGHAPLELVQKRFGNDVGEQLKTELISRGYLAASEKEGLKTLGDPLFWVRVPEERTGDDLATTTVEVEKLLPLDKALDHFTLPKEGSLTFSCEVELKPEFELPKLDNIPVKQPKLSIDDEDVDVELKRMRMTRGTFKPVEDGTIEFDDMLYAKMTMTVDGRVIVTKENVDLAARDLRMEGVPLLGLGEAAVGKRCGDVVSFAGEVPDDHENIEIRGKTANFDFSIQEIKRLEVPPFDKAFLEAIGFDSENDLREFVRNSLETRLDDTVQRALREQIGDYLTDNTKIEVPSGLSQRQTDRAVARRMIEMYQAGVPEADLRKAEDELRAKAHDQAVRDLKLFFVLEKIAEDRDIDVAEEQVNTAIAQIAQQSNKRFDRVRDELSKGDGLTTLYLQLRDQAVLESLLKEAQITEIEGPKTKKPSTAAKKPAAKKTTAETAPTKTAPVKKAPKKKAVAKAPAAKRETAKKATSKKTTAKKAPVKKARKKSS